MKPTEHYLNLIAAITLFSTAAICAKPAAPGLITRTESDGQKIRTYIRGDEFFHYITSEDGHLLIPAKDGTLYYANDSGSISSKKARNIESRSESDKSFLQSVKIQKPIIRNSTTALRKAAQQRLPTPVSFTSDSIHGLVILVQFSDTKFTVDNPKEEYTNYMNKEGYSNFGMTGSARDYFIKNSMGSFVPTFDVYGPVTLPNKASYYGGNDEDGWDSAAETMVKQAVDSLDSQIDFSKYDNDGNRYVDFVYVFYAGLGEADGGDANTIWPHASTLSLIGHSTDDGVYVNSYATSNETSGSANEEGLFALDGVGTFVHEFCHVLGLEDHYDTENNGTETPSYWDVMDAGVYNCKSNDYGLSSCTPPYLSAFERLSLGWLTPDTLKTDTTTHIIDTISTNKAYVLYNTANEFFMLENRQQTSWDEALPGHGMLIWHIDYKRSAWEDNTVNSTPGHPRVDIIEADGSTDYGDDGDSYPGSSNKTTFPGFVTWSSDTLQPKFSFIAEISGKICISNEPGANEETCNTVLTRTKASPKTESAFSFEQNALSFTVNGQLNIYKLNGENIFSRAVSNGESISLAEITNGPVIIKFSASGQPPIIRNLNIMSK